MGFKSKDERTGTYYWNQSAWGCNLKVYQNNNFKGSFTAVKSTIDSLMNGHVAYAQLLITADHGWVIAQYQCFSNGSTYETMQLWRGEDDMRRSGGTFTKLTNMVLTTHKHIPKPVNLRCKHARLVLLSVLTSGESGRCLPLQQGNPHSSDPLTQSSKLCPKSFAWKRVHVSKVNIDGQPWIHIPSHCRIPETLDHNLFQYENWKKTLLYPFQVTPIHSRSLGGARACWFCCETPADGDRQLCQGTNSLASRPPRGQVHSKGQST